MQDTGRFPRRSFAAALCGMLLAAPLAAQAQSADAFPSRAINLVVPFATGGASDVLARLIGQKLGDLIGQQVVILNRPGANGNIGTEQVVRAKPDGYTLVLVADGTVAINPNLYPNLSYDPRKDLAPVSRVALLPLMLVAHPSLKADDLKQLIALGKQPDANLHFSSAGLGSTGHLAGELIAAQSGMKLTHVPYKGGGQAVNDVVGGQLPLLMTALTTAGPFLQSKQLKAIAVTSGKRVASVPDIPTVGESGLPGFDVSSWYAVMAPAGTPRPVIEKLNRALVQAVKSPDIAQRLQTLGAEPIGDSPDDFRQVLEKDLKMWSKVVQDAGISVQ